MPTFSKFLNGFRGCKQVLDSDNSSKKHDDTVLSSAWRCQKNKSLKCPAKCYLALTDNTLSLRSKPHNHDSDLATPQRLELLTTLKRKAAEQPLSATQNLISEVLADASTEVNQTLPIHCLNLKHVHFLSCHMNSTPDPAHLQVNHTTNYTPQASSLHVNYLMTFMVDHITPAPKSGSPGSTATVVVVSCSRVRSKEGGRVRQGGEVSLDTSSLKSRAEKRNVLWVGLREVGRVHQGIEVSLDTSSLKSRAEKRNVLWVGLREVGRVHQSAEVSLDTNSSLKPRAEKRNVL